MLDLLNQLNEEQKQAVQHPSGPAIVMAGAGSGKTTVLTTRAAWLIATKQITPHQIIIVTFTNKAAQELKERITEKTGQILPMVGTFHSLCARILRQHGKYVGLDQNFSIYDSNDQQTLMKQVYNTQGYDSKRFNPKAVLGTISQAKNETITAEQYQDLAQGEYQKHVARAYYYYQRELEKANAVDFDDLLLKSLELLEKNDLVREHFQLTYTHVMVDEYQDTNTVQYLLTKILAEPQQNLYAVGDFSQSIYAWRGADYRNMLQLKQDYPDLTEYRLERNYRSTQTILDAATQVVSHNTAHPILELWTEKTSETKITCYESESDEDEALRVASYIRDLMRTIPLQEIAVLYRTNAQSRILEESLMRNSIPYQLVGGTKFYERKEIKDVISYLRLLINPADTVSEERAVGLGKRRYMLFSLWKEAILKKGFALSELEPVDTIKELLDATQYLEKYKRDTEENLQRIANIRELVNTATNFSSLNEFLENIALIQDSYFIDSKTQTSEVDQGVKLMSLHSAKGLEFTAVIIVGAEEGLLPHARSLFEKDEMEEERRLCYVGITRAKEHLFFTHARTRYQYGNKTFANRSRFINDIDASLLHFETSPHLTQIGHSDQYQKHKPIIVDDSMIDEILSGNLDIDALIDS